MAYISVFGAHMEIVDIRALLAGDIDRVHAQVISGEAVSPIQYRIGSYWLAQSIRPLFADDLFRTYLNLRFFFTFLSALMLMRFLRCHVGYGWAFGGTAYFFALLPWAYLGYHHQPADPINLFFFMLGYLAIACGRPWYIIPVVAIGALNRETIMLLPIFDLILNYDRRPVGGHIFRVALSIVAGLAVYGAVYAYFGPREHPDPLFMFAINVRDPLIMISFGVFILPPLAIALAGWRGLGEFGRRALVFSIFFICFIFMFGLFHEMRLFMPILPLVILVAMQSLQGWFKTEQATPGC
jgi:hypothetical protein